MDVDIRRLSLPELNKEHVFDRMKAERGRIAKEQRSAGEMEAKRIIAEADHQRADIAAEAYAKAQRLRAEGDAEAARTYTAAFSRDPRFYKFLRTLQAYQQFLDDKTTLFLPADAAAAGILRYQLQRPGSDAVAPAIPDRPPALGQPASRQLVGRASMNPIAAYDRELERAASKRLAPTDEQHEQSATARPPGDVPPPGARPHRRERHLRAAVFGVALLVLAAAYLGSGFYVVGTDERGVVRRFGAVVEHVAPGMHYRLPWPIDRVDVLKTTSVMKTGVGFALPDNAPVSGCLGRGVADRRHQHPQHRACAAIRGWQPR